MTHIAILDESVAVAVGGETIVHCQFHRSIAFLYKGEVTGNAEILGHKADEERGGVGSVVVGDAACSELMINFSVRRLILYEKVYTVADGLEIAHIEECERRPFRVASEVPGISWTAADPVISSPAPPGRRESGKQSRSKFRCLANELR